MAVQAPLRRVQWFLWTHNAAMRIGIMTGVYLSGIFVIWLFIANRIPEIASFAGVRNVAAGAVMFLLMLIPVLRFRREPVRMFVSGLTAWTLLTLTYIATEMRFSLLESRAGALHIFMLGGISFGFVAVFHWVFLLCAEARQRHVTQTEHVVVAPSTTPIR